jgi:hypothetical protein
MAVGTPVEHVGEWLAGKLRASLQKLSSEGKDPTATPEARAKLGAAQAKRQAERQTWEADHPGPADPERYRGEIYPKVERMSLRAIRRATGLSFAQCSRIRRGDVVPHPRWWDPLRATVGIGVATWPRSDPRWVLGLD